MLFFLPSAIPSIPSTDLRALPDPLTTTTDLATAPPPPAVVFEPRGVTATDTAVFVIGVIPFLWATYSFFTRIIDGKPFGTGKDSVIIQGGEYGPKDSSGRRVLTAGAPLFGCL